MASCLLTKNPDVKKQLDEYTDILGSESAAYYVLSENNGYDLSLTPDGKPSKLFSDLLEHFNDDRQTAIQQKAKIFSDQFKNGFQSNSEFKRKSDNDAIDFLFTTNSELAKIGTQDEYREYLNSIFPASQVESVYWHGTDSDFSLGFESAERSKGSGAPETGTEMYFNRQPWASLQYISGVNREIPDSEGFNNWVKLWWELKEILGNGRLNNDDWKNEVIGPNVRQKIPNKRGVFNRDEGLNNGSYLSERKARYGYENKTDKSFFEDVFGIKFGIDTFSNWVNKAKNKFKDLWKNKSITKGIYPAVLNVTNPIVEQNQNTYYEEQRGLFTKAKQNGNDAIISNSAQNEFNSDVIVMFNPQQNVHFLGTKQDLKQFAEWKKTGTGVEENTDPSIDTVLNFGQVYHQTSENKTFIPRNFLTDRQFKQLERNLAKLFPDIKVLWHQNLPEGEYGRIDTRDLEAITIMLSDNYQADTLPHEYAHRYIEMYRNTPLVQKAIEKFGSEEALVQAIGEQATKQVGEAWNFWKRLWEYVKTILSRQPALKTAIQFDLTNAFLRNKNLFKKSSVISQVITKGSIYFQKAPKNDIQSIRQIINGIASQIQFDEINHTYTHNGVNLVPVTTLKQRLLYSVYDDSDLTENQRDYNDKSRIIGTTVHSVMESLFNGTFSEAKFTKAKYDVNTGKLLQAALSKKAIQGLQDIYNKISKDYDLVVTEAMIADFDKNVAGTTDLVLKNKKTGEIGCYDYKTKCILLDDKKENKDGKRLWGFSYVNRSKNGAKTAINAYDFQLSVYQYMLKKLGINVTNRGIIPIVYSYDSSSDVITDAMFTKKMGTYEVNQDTGIFPITPSKVVEFDVKYRVFGEESDTYDNEYIQSRTRAFESILNKIVKSLSNKAMIDRRAGRRSQAKQLDYVVDQIGNVSEAQAMVQYLKAANDQLSRVYNQIQQRYDQEGLKNSSISWELSYLKEYRDLALAFNVVDDISGFLQRYKQFLTEEEIENIQNGINEVSQMQRNILATYKEVGTRLYMNQMQKYVKNIESEYRVKFEREYKAKYGSRNLSRMNQYINEQIELHRAEIDTKTEEWLRQQANVADSLFECSTVGQWFGTIFQSTDPFVQASVKYFDQRMQYVDRNYIQWERQLLRLTTEYEDKYGVGNWSNHRQAYDDLVEVIDGQAYLVGSIPNSFRIALNKIRKEINEDNTLTFQQRMDKLQEWYDENAPIQDIESLNEEFLQFLTEFCEKENLSEDTKKILIDNAKADKKTKKSWYHYYKNNTITLQQLDDIQDKYNDLLELHRLIDSTKYPNKKYENLMRLKQSNDIKYRLWEFLQQSIDDGDEYVSNNQKLKNRLPSIRKTNVEIASENGIKSVAQITNEYLKSNFTFTEDDAIAGQAYTDMNGNVIKQIPLYYNRFLDVENQSFDLPTIFARWYRSAKEYEAKLQMQDYLLMTAEILKNRSVKTNQASILSKLRGENQEAITKSDSTYKQFAAWLDQVFYGNSIKTTSTETGNVSIDKIMATLQKYYSLRVMGVNYISMINNATVGMLNQIIEAAGGEVIDLKSYAKAVNLYSKHVVNLSLFKDIGKRKPDDFINQLVEWFGVLEKGQPNFRARGFQRLFTTDAFYWTTNVGEHANQATFLIAALYKLKAVDKNGNELGSMIDFLSFDEDGQLVVSDRVSNFDRQRQSEFCMGVRSTLMSIHGNYADRWKVALQQYMFGKLLLMFRKWIYTGFKRRFSKRYYDNIRGRYVEGYHTTLLRVIEGTLYNPARIAVAAKLHKQIDQTKIDLLNWNTLTEQEKHNVYRAVTELGIVAMTFALGLLFREFADDEDDDRLSGFYMNIAYQMYRAYNDMSFNFNPFAMVRIIQSPVPMMSAVDDFKKLLIRTMHPFDTYTTGSRAGQNKLLESVKDAVPVVRQVERFANIQEEYDFMASKG